MNVVKLIVVIGLIFGVAGAGVTHVAAQTITWRGTVSGNWHTGGNWIGGTPPGASNDAVIPSPSGGNEFDVVISAQNAACKTISISMNSTLRIQGRVLTLGDPNNATTSTLDGGNPKFGDMPVIYFVEAGGRDAVLVIENTVTFVGVSGFGGSLDGSQTHGTDFGGRVSSAQGKIVLAFGISAAGSLQFLTDIEIQSGATAFVNDSADVMIFSEDAAEPQEIEVSGGGVINPLAGKIEFHTVSFAATSPSWSIAGGEIEVADTAASTFFQSLPFDISIKGGTLDIDHDFEHFGELFVTGVAAGSTIEVRNDVVATFDN